MADPEVPVWPRPYFKAGELPTKIMFVCFGKAPLSELPPSRSRFGLPRQELTAQVRLGEHRRQSDPSWFEGWWTGQFGALAQRDLEDDLALLTTSDVCYTLGLDLPDQPDLAAQQTIWGLSRWLCARGASVVLDVHAFRFRSRAEVEALAPGESDVTRDVKLVLETEPTREGLHLLHTRGLCKFARPELLCFIRPDDAGTLGRLVNQVARTLMEGALPSQIRLRVADGVELVAAEPVDASLRGSLGIEAGVMLGRADGAALAGIGQLVPR